MSELRKIQMNFFREQEVREVAEKIGATIRQDDFINSYATRGIKADLVIAWKGVEFGIKDGQLVFDNMFAEKVSAFTKEYILSTVKKRGRMIREYETENAYVLII